MGIKISNFKHVGLNILLLFILLAVVKSNITGPQREVVSIYDDNFATPPCRPQYFIEVYRCVKVAFGGCPSGYEAYPVPNKTEEVEIVVSDITNKDRDSSNKKKFYKYVVYNHTSCQCGNFAYRNSKLYKKITNNEVSEDYFNASYSNNPVNLLGLCRNICNSPQPRYKLHTEHPNAVAPHKYLAYQQCLPGCVVVKKNTSNKKTSFINGESVIVPLTYDVLCKAYDGTKATTQQSPTAVKLQGSPKAPVRNQLDRESNYEILVYIGSGKVILATFLLSLVLFTILIMDFALCRRKKGFLYVLVGCKNDDVDHFCQRCSQRNRVEITV